ncbi:MAG: hypothetical protein DRO39_03550 [Thermoprotei archaeon]|nr:MAG: hypothetical protein DRO39_03550 [Thermoprotei archaeon]
MGDERFLVMNPVLFVKEYLERIVNEGGDNNFVIFEVKVGEEIVGRLIKRRKDIRKFIQFAGEKGASKVLFDAPIEQFSEDELRRLRELVSMWPDFEQVELADDSISGYISIESGARLAAEVFRRVLGVSEPMDIEVTLNLE